MAIDFSFPEEVELLIQKVRDFCEQVVRPAEKQIAENEGDRKLLVNNVIKMRKAAKEWGLWLPHMPEEYGGMGLGHVAMAAVSAEAARTPASGSKAAISAVVSRRIFSGVSTGMPASSAARLTSVGIALPERPRGRSGCVTAATTSTWGASKSPRSVGRA